MSGRSGGRWRFDPGNGDPAAKIRPAVGLGKDQEARANFHCTLLLFSHRGAGGPAVSCSTAGGCWPCLGAAGDFPGPGAMANLRKTLARARLDKALGLDERAITA